MNGPDHYRQAEALLTAADIDLQVGPNFEEHDRLVRLAAVHAKLAQTAAIIDAAQTRSDVVYPGGTTFPGGWFTTITNPDAQAAWREAIT